MNPRMKEAIAAIQAGRPEQAEKIARYIVSRRPDDVDAQRLIGFLCNQSGRHAEAVAHLDAVLRFKRKQPQINYLRGLSLLALNRLREAVEDFDRALAIDGPQPDTFVNRGGALQKLQRLPEAIESYDRAIALDPRYVAAHTNRATALEQQGRLAEALAAYDLSLRIMPTAEAWCGRATVLSLQRRVDEALAAMKQAYALEPSRPWLAGEIMNLKMQLADWEHFDADCERLLAGVDKGLPVTAPGYLMPLPSTPAQQQRAAEIHARENIPMPQDGGGKSHPAVAAGLVPAAPKLRARSQSNRGGRDKPGHDESLGKDTSPKITMGYFSCDFRNHPVGQLTAGVFEEHDRSGFTVIGFSYGGAHDDDYARRIANGVDRFIDISAMSDQEAAGLSRSLGVDIAVDLTGFTFNSRQGIFAHRAAPLQAAWLGYPGTMGCTFYDYVIADRTVIPSSDQQFYTEKVVYLPDTYFPNDGRRPCPSAATTRQAEGLPEHGFVFCGFNASYKLTPAVFDVWMRLLRQVDGSVLWLRSASLAADENLRREAEKRGVPASRLVFAKYAPSTEDHLARHRLADLFLDTLPYNAHTTASDALWMGLPVLTCEGATFAGRVAASLLRAAGAEELIAQSLDDYEGMALKLAQDPALLASFRTRLEAGRSTSPLFDTRRFTRNLEAAYCQMIDDRRMG